MHIPQLVPSDTQYLVFRRLTEKVYPLQIDALPGYWWSSFDGFRQIAFALMFKALQQIAQNFGVEVDDGVGH